MIETKREPSGARPGSPCLLLLCLVCVAAGRCAAETDAERLIEAGHWKQARLLVETRFRETPDDPLANFLLSQIRNAFGDRSTPLPLARKAITLDGSIAKYHRQVAEVEGVMAQHANALQQLLLAGRFRKEIDTALSLNPRDVQACRDLLEFYLLAPGIAGGDQRKASAIANRIQQLDAAEGFLAWARVNAFHQRVEETELALRKSVSAQPPSYRAHIVLAQFYLDSNHRNPVAAERLAKEAVQLQSGRVEAYALLTQIYSDRCAWSELESTLTAAMKEVPDDLVPYYRAAESLIARGRDPGRAARYLRAYLAQEPEGNEPSAADAARLLKRLQPLSSASNSRPPLDMQPNATAPNTGR